MCVSTDCAPTVKAGDQAPVKRQMTNGIYTNKRLFFGVDAVVAGLMLEQDSYYVDLDQIERFESYVKNQVLHGTLFSDYKAVVFDASYEALVRLSQYRRQTFGLTNERIYLISTQEDLLKLKSNDPQIAQAIHDFVKKEASQNG